MTGLAVESCQQMSWSSSRVFALPCACVGVCFVMCQGALHKEDMYTRGQQLLPFFCYVSSAIGARPPAACNIAQKSCSNRKGSTHRRGRCGGWRE